MGRNARGVRGIRLKKEDEVISMGIIPLKEKDSKKKKKRYFLVVTEKGYGKKTDLENYKRQKRGGTGVKTVKITVKTGLLVTAKIIDSDQEDLIVISKHGQVIRSPLKNISQLGRSTQGVRIMRLKENDEVASATCV